MLGKLIKYECRDTAKLILVTYAALAIATVMGGLSFHQLNSRALWATSKLAETVFIILFAIYLIAIVGIFIGVFIYLCSRYYKTMYSAQGYLIHTLPVNPVSVLTAKLLTAFLWMFFTTVLAVLSFFIMLGIGTGENILSEILNYNYFNNLFSTNAFRLLGMTPAFFISYLFLSLFCSILYYILFVYASMAVGQLFQTGRTGFSILAGFCFYLLKQLCGTIALTVTNYTGIFSVLSASSEEMGSALRSIMLAGLFITVFLIALFYLVCVYVNKKRLNLE